MREKLFVVCSPFRSTAFLLAGGGIVCFLWAYWPTFVALAEKWSNAPEYSHGFLVPAFAGAVLWFRRKQVTVARLEPSAWGIVLLLAGGVLRLLGAYFYYPWFDGLSLLPSLAGLAVLLGGWHALRWAWPAIGFLLFMLPLPFVVESALGQPLQSFATLASTYFLQTAGIPALAEGNIVVLSESRIEVVQACNGLGMLVLFFAISTALAFVVERPLWQRLIILVSAVPVALVANVTRITVTGVLSEKVGSEFAHAVFHDWGGWLMMPLALALLWLELRLMDWVLEVPAIPREGGPFPYVIYPSAPTGGKASRRKRKSRHRQKGEAPLRPTF
jgi:exosortase